MDLLECSIEDARHYLEKKFRPGMSAIMENMDGISITSARAVLSIYENQTSNEPAFTIPIYSHYGLTII